MLYIFLYVGQICWTTSRKELRRLCWTMTKLNLRKKRHGSTNFHTLETMPNERKYRGPCTVHTEYGSYDPCPVPRQTDSRFLKYPFRSSSFYLLLLTNVLKTEEVRSGIVYLHSAALCKNDVEGELHCGQSDMLILFILQHLKIQRSDHKLP